MKRLRNLLYLLFHRRARKIYREYRDYRQELHDDIMDHIKNFRLPIYVQFQRSKDKAKFAKTWNDNLQEKTGLKDPEKFPYPECFSCDSFALKTISGEHDCLGVKSWLLCGHLLKGAGLKKPKQETELQKLAHEILNEKTRLFDNFKKIKEKEKP